MTDLPDLREQITGLFRDGSLYRESPAGIADAVLGVPIVASLLYECGRLLRERDEAWEEIRRLRREVEFEANGERWANCIVGRDGHGSSLCACPTGEQANQLANAPGWSLPQCSVHPSVHPEGGGS